MSATIPPIQTGATWAGSAGVRTLHRMASMDRYNRWIYARMAPHVGEDVLEVGCGIGNMTPFFLSARRLTCVDMLPESLEAVKELAESSHKVNAVLGDIADPLVVSRLGTEFDTIACINVLEHIADDSAAIVNMVQCLLPGGKLLLFVPALPFLFGHLDRALGHYRRYSRQSLLKLLSSQGLSVVGCHYMNFAAIPGWFIASRLLRREAPPRGLLWLFNCLTPVFMRLEERVALPFGQSLLCVAQKSHPEQ